MRLDTSEKAANATRGISYEIITRLSGGMVPTELPTSMRLFPMRLDENISYETMNKNICDYFL